MYAGHRRAGRAAERTCLLLTLLGLATCGGPTEPEIRGVQIEPEAGLAVGIGGTVLFSTFTLDSDGNRSFSNQADWSTDDPQIATVGSNGSAQAVSVGTTVIRAMIAGVMDSATIEVYVPPVVADYVPGTSYFGRAGYVEYIPGELPVVLSAPHGGDMTPSEIPNRTFGVTGTDRNTAELTLAVRDALVSATGYAPHVVISRLHRGKLDPNREIVEAAQGNAFAEQAWEEFQGYIERARVAVRAEFAGGMYFDMHGHGHSKDRLELGYLLSSSTLNQADASLNTLSTVQMTSIRELGRTQPQLFAELLRGPTSFGGYLEGLGVPALPSPGDPMPGSDPYFTGGYNTRRHGSLADSETVSGIQLEHHFPGLRDSAQNRAAYAVDLAAAIQAFMLEHFGFFTP